MLVKTQTIALAFVVAGFTGCGQPDGQDAVGAAQASAPLTAQAPAAALPQVNVCKSIGLVGTDTRGICGTYRADVNNDGISNLLFSTPSSFITIELGRSNGTFGAPIDADVGGTDGCMELAIADFNRDGNLDLVASLGYDLGTALVLFGTGDGHFTRGPILTPHDKASFFIDAVAVGDVNNDGNNDVVGGDSVFLGDGRGGFAAPRPIPQVAAHPLSLVDLNHDGKLDLVSSDRVALGNGDGSFAVAKTISSNPKATVNFMWSELAGDFNNDGNIDLAGVAVFTSTGALTAGVMFGRGDGTFGSELQLGGDRSFSGAPHTTVIVDADHDGNLDLMLGTWNDDALILFGDGHGHFTRRQDLGVNSASVSAAAVGSTTEIVVAYPPLTGLRCGS